MHNCDAEGQLIGFAVAAVFVDALYCDVAVAGVEKFGFGGEVDDDEPANGAEHDGDDAFDDELAVLVGR